MNTKGIALKGDKKSGFKITKKEESKVSGNALNKKVSVEGKIPTGKYVVIENKAGKFYLVQSDKVK